MKRLISLMLLMILLCSCSKKDFLNKKSDTNVLVPKTIEDYQNLLDNTETLNQTPDLPGLSSDEYYYPDEATWINSDSKTEKNAYVWAKNIFEGATCESWNTSYRQVLIANVVLEGIDKASSSELNGNKDHVKAQAYFARASAYYGLVTTFSQGYDDIKSRTDLGVPLRLSSEVKVNLPRSSVLETYKQIISDLESAIKSIAELVPGKSRNRPCKSAIYGLLSRVYLSMRKYTDANSAADSCLALYNQLLDYNNLDKSTNTPFPMLNIENLISVQQIDNNINFSSFFIERDIIKIDSNLYKLYDENDLRKHIFFRLDQKLRPSYKRGYLGVKGSAYSGVAMDEIYLIKAECLIRNNNRPGALRFLNTLLSNRYRKGTFQPVEESDLNKTLQLILQERRKELINRGLRWIDIKRLNLDGAAITLVRKINNTEYKLVPNSLLYAFPIPDDEITRSGINQNQR